MALPANKTPQPSSYSKRALHEMEVERKREEQERITGWTVIWTLFLFKMATVGLIWYASAGSSDGTRKTTEALIVTTWFWLVIPAIAISGFVGYRVRLRAARKRVEELRRAEFMASHRRGVSGGSGSELTDAERARLRAVQGRSENIEGNGVG